MARVRTLKEAHNIIKAEDSGSSISYTLIRRLVLTGKVPTMKSGKKRLIDVDVLIKYINNSLAG
jgi:hypothetical protein